VRVPRGEREEAEDEGHAHARKRVVKWQAASNGSSPGEQTHNADAGGNVILLALQHSLGEVDRVLDRPGLEELLWMVAVGRGERGAQE
jgi:hypothetical protein